MTLRLQNSQYDYMNALTHIYNIDKTSALINPNKMMTRAQRSAIHHCVDANPKREISTA
jgi:hypothetical protein